MPWCHRALALAVAIPLCSAGLLPGATAEAARVKDLGHFYGHRSNALTGAGLVVGLARTGDSQRNAAAIRTLANRLQGLGVSLDTEDILSRNVAQVTVSAQLQVDHRIGSRLDLTVASTGDATSLEGGYLLMTLLTGADGQVYAVGEGPVIVGGYLAEAQGSQSRKNTPTVARVVQGGVVEAEVPSAIDYDAQRVAEFILREPDFTTANRLAESIDSAFGLPLAHAISSATIKLQIPAAFHGDFAQFASVIEAVEVVVDSPARVVINERTGTVVMGADVRIAAVAVAHGGLTIEVRRDVNISQPGPLSGGQTVVAPTAAISAQEGEDDLEVIEGTTIGDVVTGLNAMGVKPRDLMVILQAIKAAGALHAEIVTI